MDIPGKDDDVDDGDDNNVTPGVGWTSLVKMMMMMMMMMMMVMMKNVTPGGWMSLGDGT